MVAATRVFGLEPAMTGSNPLATEVRMPASKSSTAATEAAKRFF